MKSLLKNLGLLLIIIAAVALLPLLLLIVCAQPYAAVFAFVLLAIKVFILIKRR